MTRTKPADAISTEPRQLRRKLGPTAWVVLEELVAAARPGPGARLVSQVTAVGLAAELGIGRDAAVAALGRLRRYGLVAFAAERQTGTGRFGAGRYVVSDGAAAVISGLGAVSLRDIPLEVRAEGGNRRSGSRSGPASSVRRTEVAGGQGSLFELMVDADGGGGAVGEDVGRHEFDGEEVGGGGVGPGTSTRTCIEDATCRR